MCWSLKKESGNVRFNDKQKQFLIDKFNNGIVCGHEEEPKNVSGALQFSTNPDHADGSKMFRMEDFFCLSPGLFCKYPFVSMLLLKKMLMKKSKSDTTFHNSH